jgi:hypothetical protein
MAAPTIGPAAIGRPGRAIRRPEFDVMQALVVAGLGETLDRPNVNSCCSRCRRLAIGRITAQDAMATAARKEVRDERSIRRTRV